MSEDHQLLEGVKVNSSEARNGAQNAAEKQPLNVRFNDSGRKTKSPLNSIPKSINKSESLSNFHVLPENLRQNALTFTFVMHFSQNGLNLVEDEEKICRKFEQN